MDYLVTIRVERRCLGEWTSGDQQVVVWAESVGVAEQLGRGYVLLVDPDNERIASVSAEPLA